ncbi:hypothetical protein Rsub_12037 [Raphidocelis subcapitata]|uniref:Uncharacterized protein n=1 Tax=Raphidocelis subcapitata TaxID=307507 RepID=A0A2V0PP93_9CHLO|nr:hypothetical protein Rsub_12037 [Raphidocelis subcapitata]|eukprot:GBF99277.1 hypothetical protein Rsub_12037 [Raphidocelis subcapitata]
MTAAWRQARALLVPAAKGAIFGAALYFAADTASDVYTFFAVRRAALARARASPDVAALVGEPFSPGPWYDGTLGFSHRDRVAHATFQIAGAARTTDVVARAARRGEGPRANALYNAFGPGEWELVSCSAMFPGEGGLAVPRSIMEPQPPAAGGGGGGGSAAGECLPCQQQQQQQQPKPAAAGGAGWWRWWGRAKDGGGGGGGGGK